MKKEAFPLTIPRRLSLIMHRGKKPNIPSQVYKIKPHKFIIVWLPRGSSESFTSGTSPSHRMKKGVVISRHSSQICSKDLSCAFFLSSIYKTTAETYPEKTFQIIQPSFNYRHHFHIRREYRFKKASGISLRLS